MHTVVRSARGQLCVGAAAVRCLPGPVALRVQWRRTRLGYIREGGNGGRGHTQAFPERPRGRVWYRCAVRNTRVGYRCLVLGSTPISAGHSDCPRGASDEICSQRRTQRAERTGLSIAAAAHRVSVAAGALACPFRPSWRCQAGASADHPEPGRSKVARFFLQSNTRPD